MLASRAGAGVLGPRGEQIELGRPVNVNRRNVFQGLMIGLMKPGGMAVEAEDGQTFVRVLPNPNGFTLDPFR